jgi:hypothetical protein
MEQISLSTFNKILELPKASMKELSVMLSEVRDEDNLVIRDKVFKSTNERRAYNKRVQVLKESGIVKEVEVRLQQQGQYYKFIMLSPYLFPPTNIRLSRLLWDGY